MAKEKALQTMSSMSSAQIVSATAMHSKSAGLGLGLTPPVSYPGAVSCLPHSPAKLFLSTYPSRLPKPAPLGSVSLLVVISSAFLLYCSCYIYTWGGSSVYWARCDFCFVF